MVWTASIKAGPSRGLLQNIIRAGILAVVIGSIITALLLREEFGASHVGYAAVALSALVASAGIVIPVPALATACTTAIFLNPFLVGIIAGSFETVGELSGYYLGYVGRDALAKSRFYQRMERWMRRRGWLLLFFVSLVPNPVFDLAGIAAGTLRYPIGRFLAVVWVGKVVKFLIFAYACTVGANWLTGVFGISD